MTAKMRRRAVTRTVRGTVVASLFAAAALSTAVLATPASASATAAGDPDKVIPEGGAVAPYGPSCAAGYHCVFILNIGSSKHPYFSSDENFVGDTFENGLHVNDNVWSASNSSTGGYESHYYYGANYTGGRVFCVNPGSSVASTRLTSDGIAGNGIGQRDEASSLLLIRGTTVRCF